MTHLFSGLAFGVFGLFVLWMTLDLPAAGSLSEDAALFPRITGFGLFTVGAFLVFQGLLRVRSTGSMGVEEEEATEDRGAEQPILYSSPEESALREPSAGPKRTYRYLVPFMLLTILYAWLSFQVGVGYVTATFVFLCTVIYWLAQDKGLRTLLSSILLSGGIAGGIYIVFVLLLQIPVPRGFFL